MNSSPLNLGSVVPGDPGLFRAVNDFARATPWLHEPLRLYAAYGVALFAVLLLGAWWIARRQGDERAMVAALWAPIGMLLALALNQPLGNAIAEARPYTSLANVLVLVPRSSDFSFPSDHAVMAGAVAAGVFLANRRLGAVALVAAVLMASTRVYVGAHFPGDVIAGLALGAVVTLLAFVPARPALAMLVLRLQRGRLRTLVQGRLVERRPGTNGNDGTSSRRIDVDA